MTLKNIGQGSKQPKLLHEDESFWAR